MKSLVRAAGLATCCLFATLSVAPAAEFPMSAVELDRIVAGNQLFTPNSAFAPVGSQVSPGLLNPAPPPPPPPPPPGPTTPPSSQVTFSDGGASATITIPTVPPGSQVSIDYTVQSGGGRSLAGIQTQGSITGGTNSQFTGGGNSTTVTGGL